MQGRKGNFLQRRWQLNVTQSKRDLKLKDMPGSVPLVVFDFDHTLLDCNTDVEIQKLSPGGKLPDALKGRMNEIEWTDFMQEVFDHLHANGFAIYSGCCEDDDNIGETICRHNHYFRF